MKKKILIPVMILVFISLIFLVNGGIANSLTAYYTASNNTILEDLTNNYDGIKIGDIANTANSVIGDAQDLNTNGAVNLQRNHSVFMPSTSDWSLQIWVYIPATQPSESKVIVSGRNVSGSRGFSIDETDNGLIRYTAQNTSGQGQSMAITSNIEFDDDSYHHIIARFHANINGTQDNISLFIDGIQHNGSYNYTDMILINNRENLTLGSHPDTSSPATQFDIDEIGFWGRLLTESEISELYNSGSGLNFYGERAISTNNTINSSGRINFTNINTIVNVSLSNTTSVNFTLISPNGSTNYLNLNGTNTTISSLRENWTSKNFIIDYNGTWKYEINYSFADNLTDFENGTFTYIDGEFPNITRIEPASDTITGGTPHAVVLNISINDSTQITSCVYDIPAEFSPVQKNISMELNGNTTNLFYANSTAIISTQGTRDIFFYCNDSAGNQETYSFSLTTKESSGQANLGGGGGGGSSDESTIQCGDAGSEVFWTANVGVGGGGRETFFVSQASITEKEIFFTNEGSKEITITLTCSGDDCNLINLKNNTLVLPNDKKSYTMEHTLTIPSTYSAKWLGLGSSKDITYNINVEDNQGNVGCSETILYTAKVDNVLGTLFTLGNSPINLFGGLAIGIIVLAISLNITNNLKNIPRVITIILSIIMGITAMWLFLLFR